MKTFGAFVCIIALCYAATTHRPHATHEPSEVDSVTFQYVSATHHLVVRWIPDKNTYECYISTMTMAERNQIHTDAGMRAVETRVLGQLSSGTMVTDTTTLDQHDVKACGTGRNHTMPVFYTITV
ncbi:uncharacterized protein LOC127880169 isoform X1 [Dreissena polymorpha]|uniref:Uncharacterized protein n=1 Tax=Dreissena polymorpha TaxID=45954 RepID=A0A9D4KIT7_DREPO|nr:uncharacterized protein LOC127880169 isoform X1 [Dreissena polymorpha]KAH3840259.1 hypothetical protein DPMN_113706 [Dreissena polymorpha]